MIKLVNGVAIEMTLEEVAQFEATRVAGNVEKVPRSVTRRQAMQQLIIEGLDDDVEAVIAAIPDATQRKLFTVWYKDSQVFERDRPEILMVWQALGRTQEQLDNTFIAAAKL